MKIAYYSHYFFPEIGAPSARILDLAREWVASGEAVQVVTCFPNHPTGQLYPGYFSRWHAEEVIEGIVVHRHWSYVTPNKGIIKKTIGHVTFLLASVLCSGRKEADVFIGTSPTLFAAIAAAIVARRNRKPFVMEVRDLWPAVFVELGVLKNRWLIAILERLELALYRRATRIVTVTEAFRQNLIERGIPPEKVKTIPNGANMGFWDASRDDGGLRQRLELNKKFIVLYIGAHGISQALSSVMTAAQRLQSHDRIRFVFVGEGAEREQLMHRAKAERIGNVLFLDPVGKEEVKHYYALADVCLVPLRNIPLFDTFIPSKMFEMLAMSRPVVASLRGEAAEILRASGGALVVAPEDSAAIADAILSIESDSENSAAMGKAGRVFVAGHYSRDALAARYLDVLREAVQVS